MTPEELKYIEERAKEYAAKCHGQNTWQGYVAGALSEREEVTRWRDIPTDASGFASDAALDEIFRNLPRLVKDRRNEDIELINYDNAAEWRGDLERTSSRYQWRPIHENRVTTSHE